MSALRQHSFILAIVLFLTCSTIVRSQDAAAPAQPPAVQTPAAQPTTTPAAATKNDPERQHALEVYDSGKFVEAMPLLEKLAADRPNDVVVTERLAFSMLAYASTISDPELKKKARVRARSLALKAKEAGDKSALLQMMLDTPEDGSSTPFSSRKEVDDVMKAAEADFVRGDWEKARDGYLHALMLDPKDYEAALFIGDVYFKQHVNGSAGEWFARAIEIDPNRETAYRYWGDALSALGKIPEAREKYIRAVVAEPYNNRSWVGLNQWLQAAKLKLNWVRLQDKGSVAQKDDKHINITIDPDSLGKNDPAGPAWLAYSMNRALWHGDKFKKEFPNEAAYRRTMREEVEGLHMMVAVLARPENIPNLDASLAGLVKIDQSGFLEPFALLNRADKDIAQDYGPYRESHRDVIYRYFDEFAVPKAPAQ